MSSFDTGTDQLLCEVKDRVCVFTLNRPDARNALAPEMTSALGRGITWAAQADEVGAVLITGAGSAFCSGGDVKAMGARNSGSKPPSVEKQFQELKARHMAIGGALYQLRKPTIAALPGAAAGAGMAIALACDMRICSDNAFLTTGYARIGLSGDYGIAWLLTRVVGPARARELLLSSRRVTSDEALTLGLVNRVTSSEGLLSEAIEWAREFANGPGVAHAYIKDNLDEALFIDHATAIEKEADRLLKSRTTQDHKEAVTAFAEKREPVFTGE